MKFEEEIFWKKHIHNNDERILSWDISEILFETFNIHHDINKKDSIKKKKKKFLV